MAIPFSTEPLLTNVLSRLSKDELEWLEAYLWFTRAIAGGAGVVTIDTDQELDPETAKKWEICALALGQGITSAEQVRAIRNTSPIIHSTAKLHLAALIAKLSYWSAIS